MLSSSLGLDLGISMDLIKNTLKYGPYKDSRVDLSTYVLAFDH